VTCVGDRLEGTGKANGVVTLSCGEYPLKQDGCFTRIRRGGRDTLADVASKRLAFSRDRAKSLNGYERRQIMLHQCGVFRGHALSCHLGCCDGRDRGVGKVGVRDGVGDCDVSVIN
jgi:hypothetical protein